MAEEWRLQQWAQGRDVPEFEKHTVETEAPEKDWLRPARVPGSPQRLLKWERVCV